MALRYDLPKSATAPFVDGRSSDEFHNIGERAVPLRLVDFHQVVELR